MYQILNIHKTLSIHKARPTLSIEDKNVIYMGATQRRPYRPEHALANFSPLFVRLSIPLFLKFRFDEKQREGIELFDMIEPIY